MGNCVFCKIIEGKIPAKIIDQNDHVIVFLDLKNHPLVVTKKHIQNIYTLDEALGNFVMQMVMRIVKATKKGLSADGINLIQNNEAAAGQEVMHFHLHIKPRFVGDRVRLHMPDESIDEAQKQATLDKIKNALE